jgi:hypothetical protein
MMEKYNDLVDRYGAWLRERTTLADVKGTCEITTPFLDRHNDRLQIYVQFHKDGSLRLTDDGYVIADLLASGCSLASTGRKKMLDTIVNGYGVAVTEGELSVEATELDFPRKKHLLIQAMLAVNNLSNLSKSKVANLFFNDVKNFLDENSVRYTEDVVFHGKSGFIHKFDYVIPKSPTEPERVLKAVNQPTRENASSLLFAWTDMRDTRAADSQMYAILNDEGKKIDRNIVSSLEHYQIRPLFWSQRSKFASQLAA